MDKLTCRLLPFASADGPTNMATDEVLLQSAAAGVATLRFYSWSPPTLSLGYFQSEKVRLSDPLLAALPWVRRPSGGQTLVHHHEVTYALALPAGSWQSGLPWPLRMHEIIAAALRSLGVDARLHPADDAASSTGPLCFHHFTAGDLIVAGAKVVGSAQRKRRGALLQHGGILLARSAHTPALPGLRELTGQDLSPAQVASHVLQEFVNATQTECVEQSLNDQETKELHQWVQAKYSTPGWNNKR